MARRGLLIAVIALALAPAAGARAQASSATTFGVSVNRVFNDDFTPASWQAPLQAVHDSGIRQARSDAFWMWAEPTAPVNGEHSYVWTQLDAEAGALAEHGLTWLPILDYSATWAASDPSDYHSPPTNLADYVAYAAAFAKRYGRGGTYWAEHPTGALPVSVYEIWNEPNGAWFWSPSPDAAAYADMYLQARAAIKAVDPNARVVIGGLVADASFIDAMYAARPELRGNVDAVGWHAYAPTVNGTIGTVKALRKALERVGDPNVPIHVTELGWPTRGTGHGSEIVLPEEARAAALEATVDTLARSDCGVEQITPYTWTTPEADSNGIEDWYGLRHPNGASTPTSDAYSRVIARWDSAPVTDRLRICHPPDADADGIPDSEDRDDDNDGVRDSADAFPFDPGETSDIDLDGIGDNADIDDDGDGVPDMFDAFPADPAESADSDLDGQGDNADRDDDNDGLSDKAERLAGSSPTDFDSDDDGLPDVAERLTSPTRADTDRDGIPDGVEAAVTLPVPDPPGAATGTDLTRFHPDLDPSTRTNPLRADTDRDRLPDGNEDRNHDGRRDRGETDPRKRDKPRIARHRSR